jgi:acetyl-CoA synthetase
VTRSRDSIARSNIGSYTERMARFDWSMAEAELGWREGGPINIGVYCTDRICGQGLGGKAALLWEGSEENERSFTFDELRVATNTYAAFLRGMGVNPGDRVCVFMDRIPDLYISFLGILKLGAIVQPLFSAFGPESLVVRLQDADTKVALTTMRHVRKLRKIRHELPNLETVVVVDCTDPSKLRDGEVAFDLGGAAPVEGDAFRAPLHLGHHGQAEGRAPRPRFRDPAVYHGQVGAGPAAR